jgi:saccharopine dehydrogenase-like NADP-dependent oxidoreductase
MKKILILGAGLVSRPIVRYLLEQPDCQVTMASRTVSKAEKCIDCHPQGSAICLDCEDDHSLENLVSQADITVSLLPYRYHPKVATYCMKHQNHLVTTSYISDQMRGFHTQAQKEGVLLLNECGLDPGIDHMSAMKIIHEVNRKGGKIMSFRSTTGALPSYEANTNPFGYKFSWAPRGVLLASKNSSRWLQHGIEISVPGEQLFENYTLEDIPGIGTFENYPNRDSVPYKTFYGLTQAHTIYRGTFRMPGWCETMRIIVKLGWLSEKIHTNFKGKTYGDLTRFLIGADPETNLLEATAAYLQLPTYSTVIKRLEWLGLFGNEPLPENTDNPLDYLNVLTMKKMSLGKNERDMVVMHHEFIVHNHKKKECITSTLVEYGIPGGDSAIARTVALPAGIAVKLILEGKINTVGVHIPVLPEIYIPILDELQQMKITFLERTTDIE